MWYVVALRDNVFFKMCAVLIARFRANLSYAVIVDAEDGVGEVAQRISYWGASWEENEGREQLCCRRDGRVRYDSMLGDSLLWDEAMYSQCSYWES